MEDEKVSSEILALKKGYTEDPYPSMQKRKEWLRNLEELLLGSEQNFIDAITKDFSHRSKFETEICELLPTYSALKHSCRNLSKWMKVKKRKTDPIFWFGSSSILYQPIGVVAIISPWNYPLQLTFIPLINALAAGNRVLLKPSEKTHHFSMLLEKIFYEGFDRSVARVICGDQSTAKRIAQDKGIDHLFFTGSTKGGKEVAKYAAENLTPTTLELGGKSPAYITKSASLTNSLHRIILGKMLNAGQTCIAPDYLIVHRKYELNFVETFFKILGKLYPEIMENSDYSAIINKERLEHLLQLLEDARDKGGNIYIISEGTVEMLGDKKNISEMTTSTGKPERKLSPSLILNPNFRMNLLNEEIFGPILPVFFVDSDAEAFNLVEKNQRPLAFYWFGDQKESRQKWLKNIVAGGVTINDCLLHCVQNDLPFGGVSYSGSGTYHGIWGFENFSHRKSIFKQSKFSAMKSVSPPYTKTKYKLLRMLRFLI